MKLGITCLITLAISLPNIFGKSTAEPSDYISTTKTIPEEYLYSTKTVPETYLTTTTKTIPEEYLYSTKTVPEEYLTTKALPDLYPETVPNIFTKTINYNKYDSPKTIPIVPPTTVPPLKPNTVFIAPPSVTTTTSLVSEETDVPTEIDPYEINNSCTYPHVKRGCSFQEGTPYIKEKEDGCIDIICLIPCPMEIDQPEIPEGIPNFCVCTINDDDKRYNKDECLEKLNELGFNKIEIVPVVHYLEESIEN